MSPTAPAPTAAGDEIRSEQALADLVTGHRGDLAYDPVFEGLLRENHPVYDGRGAAAVTRMRGWLLLGLGENRLADSALPFVLEELESGHDAYLTAAAAHALRRAAPRAEYVPALLSGLYYLRFRDDAVSLTEYGGYGAPDPHTTAVTEILKTLGWLGSAARSALPRLRALRREGGLSAAAAERLDRVIARIEAAGPPDEPQAAPPTAPCCCSAGEPQPEASASPPASLIADVQFQDQDGEILRFSDFFFGRPSIVVFFYTRCDNPTKCPLTVARLGRIQRLLREEGLGAEVRTAAITYDPQFDLPARLARYAATWGAEPDAHHKMLRTVDSFDPVRSYFDLGVNYVSSVVNRHRIEAFVLGSEGEIRTAATRLQWQAATLVERAKSLLADPAAS